jgi:phytoene/squalene synthetase
LRLTLAQAITRAASRQTYYTICLLVDRPLVEDAYRAYAYFRWVDDVLDADTPSGSDWGEAERSASLQFVRRQRWLLEACLRGEGPRVADPHEAMLVELVRGLGALGTLTPESGPTCPGGSGLEAYLHHMMRVMEFDARRRGRLVSQEELDAYTGWLAIGVTEAVAHFIGSDAAAPRDKARYLAASGAHILHMLRDTHTDVRAGYYNIPREVLASQRIAPQDIGSEAYRAWVQGRVQLARNQLDAGRGYLARIANRRYRLAGLAYVARFEWLIETLERDGYRLRPRYGGGLGVGLRAAWRTSAGTLRPAVPDRSSASIAPAPQRRP